MIEITMPRLSDSMEEGTILSWLAEDGAAVARGAELAEIETDKANMTFESDGAGVLHRVASVGDSLPVGAVIAYLLADGEDAPASGSGQAGLPAGPAATAGEDTPSGAPSPAVAPPDGSASAGSAPAEPAPGGRVKASPVARRLAGELGVDLSSLAGSGPGGRIVKVDVEAAAAAPAAPAAPAPAAPAAPAAGGSGKGETTVVELSRMQTLVARRMAEAKATVPEFTLSTEIDIEGCVALRAELKALAGEGGTVPSYNDMVVKACGLALREFPRANGSYKDGRFELYSRVNVGVAVAAGDALVVPTVFDADAKPLGAIAVEARALAERVRSGAITPPELSGGTFTVSNLGMFGVTDFTAVINLPQAAILAVGALTPRPVVRDGEVVVRHGMAVTLSCDHRILYGADAARFLARVRELLERPLALLV